VSIAGTEGAFIWTGLFVAPLDNKTAPCSAIVISTWFLQPFSNKHLADAVASSTDWTGSPLVSSACHIENEVEQYTTRENKCGFKRLKMMSHI